MTFFEAQQHYLQACQRYAAEGTEIARRRMLEAARRVDAVFRATFGEVERSVPRAS